MAVDRETVQIIHDKIALVREACGSLMLHTIEDDEHGICIHPGNDPDLEFRGDNLSYVLDWVVEAVRRASTDHITLMEARDRVLNEMTNPPPPVLRLV